MEQASRAAGPASPKVVVVVPTYEERENLPLLIGLLKGLDLPNLHVLVVDDNSPDGTGDVADEIAAESAGTVTVLHRTEKDGLGRAYVAGMTRALAEGADVVVQMDADLSHPARALPLMVRTLLAGEEGLGGDAGLAVDEGLAGDAGPAVVLGSRYVAGGALATEWAWHRRALSAWANFYVNAVLRLGVRDATAGFKAWRATALQAIDLPSVRSNGYSFQVEMNYRAIRRGLRIVEVPITFEERANGESKLSLRVQAESALTPWRLRFGRRGAGN
ncbi:polyprenol monophosphomannose synthase [Streptomyces sp. NPDC093510]|uniref:polyprenol monophosphomannose synthase n=1 Tax=Streptomyces sp. NPDC093510 TaxID=3155199 RepID=UPI0034263511